MSDPVAIERRSPDALDTPCVEWQGARTASGYGNRFRHGRYVGAHRIAWEETFGPIPEGLCVLHRCDNRPCINPEHLFLGTKGDNIRDAIAKGRWVPYQRAWTHCRQGHEYTPENTRIALRGGAPKRICRACARDAATRHRVLLPEPTSCIVCGEPLPPRKYRANPRKYCSARCTTAAYRQRKKAMDV